MPMRKRTDKEIAVDTSIMLNFEMSDLLHAHYMKCSVDFVAERRKMVAMWQNRPERKRNEKGHYVS